MLLRDDRSRDPDREAYRERQNYGDRHRDHQDRSIPHRVRDKPRDRDSDDGTRPSDNERRGEGQRNWRDRRTSPGM